MSTMLAPAPRLPLRSLVRRDPVGGAWAALAGQRAVPTWATRVGIRAACDLLGLKPGDAVLVPAYNCGSEIDALLDARLALLPYAVGADLVVRAEVLEQAITPGVKAIYLTHYFGLPQPEGQAIRALCDRHGLALMEDCALSLLSQTGRLGDVAFHCFYKYFPVGSGGALVVNRADLPLPQIDRKPPARPALKLLGQALAFAVLGPSGIGALKSLRRRLRKPRAGGGAERQDFPDMPRDYYLDPGLKGARMSWLVARALGGMSLVQAIAARQANFRTYQRLLAGVPGARPLIAELPEGACPLNMPVLVADRDRLARELGELGIAVAPWWAGYHRALDFTPFAEARHLKDNVLALPLHQGLTEAQIAAVVAALKERLQALGRFQAPE